MDIINNDTGSSSVKDYRKIFQGDFLKKINSYPDLYTARIMFEDSTKLGKKTFTRYCSGETAPMGDLVLVVYQFIYELDSKIKTFQSLNEAAKTVYLSACHGELTDADFPTLTTKSPIHHRIYIMTMNGNSISTDDFVEEWGRQGRIAIDEMCENNIISEISTGMYVKGKNRSSFPSNELYAHSKFLLNSTNVQEAIDEDTMGNMLEFHTLNLSDKGVALLQKATLEYIQLINTIEESNNGDIQSATCLLNRIVNKDWKSKQDKKKELQ
jgi:hypothetical protein